MHQRVLTAVACGQEGLLVEEGVGAEGVEIAGASGGVQGDPPRQIHQHERLQVQNNRSVGTTASSRGGEIYPCRSASIKGHGSAGVQPHAGVPSGSAAQQWHMMEHLMTHRLCKTYVWQQPQITYTHVQVPVQLVGNFVQLLLGGFWSDICRQLPNVTASNSSNHSLSMSGLRPQQQAAAGVVQAYQVGRCACRSCWLVQMHVVQQTGGV